MIRFSELRFSDDMKRLYLSCFVENFEVYTGVYIKSISVEYYKNRLSTGNPSEKAIKIYDNTEDDTTVRTYTGSPSVDIELKNLGIGSLEGGIIYVYVECDGFTGRLGMVDCSWGKPITIGVAVDWERLYRIGMGNINSVVRSSGRCSVDSGFVDFILMWNAFKLALETCDYDTADKIWDTLNGGRISAIAHSSPCGCR